MVPITEEGMSDLKASPITVWYLMKRQPVCVKTTAQRAAFKLVASLCVNLLPSVSRIMLFSSLLWKRNTRLRVLGDKIETAIWSQGNGSKDERY